MALALLLPGCIEPTPPAGDARAEVLAFGLRVVETYLRSDPHAFRALLAETTYTLEGEGPFTLADVDAWLFAELPFPSRRDYTAYTLDDDEATYAPRVLAYDEVVLEYPAFANVTWDGWVPDGDDLIFAGGDVKEGQTSFLWEDILAFGVTRETGEWRLKAFSG